LQHTAKTGEATHLGATAEGTQPSLEDVATAANLARSLLRVARNKGAAGVDGESVAAVVGRTPRLLPRVRKELLEETYRPDDVRRAWIPKSGGGRRGLGIPTVVDRWVQQGVHQVLSPVFEADFHPSSHGFRPERGVKTALADVRQHLAAGYVWLVNIDLSNFFDQVHHQRLLSRLSKRVGDGRLLQLIHRFLKARVALPEGIRVPTKEGTPQGGPLSPLLSNVVLDELDWELERRGLRFVRYADDFVIFLRSERAAHRVMASVTGFIERRLRLEVNRDKCAVTGPDDTHFLGFRFGIGPSGDVEVHLSQRSIDRLRLRIRELTPRNWGQPLERCMQQVSRYFNGWMSHFRWLTTAGAERLKPFDSHVRRRLRAIVIHHHRRDRYLYRHLRKRGVSHRAAHGTAFRRRGYWYRSNLPGIMHAYPVPWFRVRILSLAEAWSRHSARSSAQVQLSLF
jgi:group II intron reverse transcriptase/maturase